MLEHFKHMLFTQGQETAQSMTMKAAPPMAVVGAHMAGIPIADWVQYVTLAYVMLLVIHKMWHMAIEAYNFWVLKKRDAPSNPDE